jgi:F-type H+-transporting ATPase subunit delta
MKNSKVVDGIIDYLKNEDLLDVVPELITALKKIGNNNSVEAIVESAVLLSTKETGEIKILIAEKFLWTGEVKYIVVPELVGGLRITVGDQVMDLSVRAKLNNIYEQI